MKTYLKYYNVCEAPKSYLVTDYTMRYIHFVLLLLQLLLWPLAVLAIYELTFLIRNIHTRTHTHTHTHYNTLPYLNDHEHSLSEQRNLNLKLANQSHFL